MGNVLATVGIKALYYKKLSASEIAAARTSGAMPSTGFSAVDVYQDSATFKEGDGNSTTHKSETSTKKIVIKTKGDKQLVFSIMDPSKQERADFEGGVYTPATPGGEDEDPTPATYKEPASYTPIKMAIIILPDDGDALHIPLADVLGKINTTYAKTGISLLDVTADPEVPITYTEDQTIPGQNSGGA